MRTAPLLMAGAFAALSACTPPQSQEPPPQFTPQEARDTTLTVQFLQCTLVNKERIAAVHPNDVDYVMEFCANMVGFDLENFGRVMDQMTITYGDNWPDMIAELFEEEQLRYYEPPLIPNNLEDIGF